MRFLRSAGALRFLLLAPALLLLAAPQVLELPLKPKSVRFAVIGDNGTGERPEYEVGRQMASFREKFPFQFVLMMGDNLYGTQGPADFRNKFANPYATLLTAGVKFYATLGNHDDPNQRFYKPFNMDGNRYYMFTRGDVQFFALDSNYMDSGQIAWLRRGLDESPSRWKICFFHHPLYSDARYHGPDRDLRAQLEPVLAHYGVNVVFSGHEHVYERLNPQNGVRYFVLGNSGKLRYHDLRPSPDMARGFDTDRAFLAVEISGDEFYFQTISRTGETVDAGTFQRQNLNAAAIRR